VSGKARAAGHAVFQSPVASAIPLTYFIPLTYLSNDAWQRVSEEARLFSKAGLLFLRSLRESGLNSAR